MTRCPYPEPTDVPGAYLSCFLVARKPPLHQEGEGLIEPRPLVINTANASHFSIIQQPVANEAFVVLLDSFLYSSCPKPCPCMSLVSYSFHPRMLSLISGRGFAKFRRAQSARYLLLLQEPPLLKSWVRPCVPSFMILYVV